MKISETIKILSMIRNYVNNKHEEALDIAIESLKNNQKYRWHDLRENPEDLPEDLTPVIAIDKNGDLLMAETVYEPEYAESGYWRWWSLYNFGKIDSPIIAWREIEPFEVNKYEG